MLADNDTGREDGRMDGMRERNAVVKGSFNQATIQTTSDSERGGGFSPATGLFAVFSILYLLLYFVVTVITLVWSAMV